MCGPVEIVTAVVGVALVSFRRLISKHIIGAQNTTWGFGFGVRAEQVARVVVAVVGVGGVTFSILSCLGRLP